MNIITYNAKKLTAEIEWQGKIRILSEEAVKLSGYDIKKEIPDEAVPRLLILSEEILAWQYLTNQISQYCKTAKGYYDKLFSKGFSRQASKKAVDKAKGYGYIDDFAYAERFVETNSAKKGYFRLKSELLKKGVPNDIVENVLENLPKQDDEILLLAKKLSKIPPTTREEKAKLARKLASRGFSYDEINRAIYSLCNGEELD